MTDINEEALDKAAREGYAVRCKTNGPRVLARYASDDIMAMQFADARVIVSAYVDALTPAEKAGVGDGDLIEHAVWLEACATNEPSESDAGRLWQIAQLLRALSTTKPAQGDGVEHRPGCDFKHSPIKLCDCPAAIAAQGDDAQEGTR